jgi:hypothetical protein
MRLLATSIRLRPVCCNAKIVLSANPGGFQTVAAKEYCGAQKIDSSA